MPALSRHMFIMVRLDAIASVDALWNIALMKRGREVKKVRKVKRRSTPAGLSIALLIGAVFTLSACATVKGLGRDIQSVGQAGSDAINR